MCHHGLVKILVMDELCRQGREWRDFVKEITLSPEHPPTEDVPPTVDVPTETPSIDVPLLDITPSMADTSLPANNPLVSDQAEDSPFVNPQSNNVVHEQTLA